MAPVGGAVGGMKVQGKRIFSRPIPRSEPRAVGARRAEGRAPDLHHAQARGLLGELGLGGGEGLGLGLGDEPAVKRLALGDEVVLTLEKHVVGGDAVPPPQLAGDAPVADVACTG
jgi:hypothetical protein